MLSIGVQADWRKLLMANYPVDAALLLPYVPFGTSLDTWEGDCYVSMVGFQFMRSRLNGIPIPFHHSFEEVNLRFYVFREEEGVRKRGVVFFREYVPRPAVTFIANTVFHEHYETIPMRHQWQQQADTLLVSYGWKKKQWHSMEIESHSQLNPLISGSPEEFFTEHYWGYTQLHASKTMEYRVDHAPWETYRTLSYQVNIDFETNYGKPFSFLNHLSPASVFLAEGSPMTLHKSQMFEKV